MPMHVHGANEGQGEEPRERGWGWDTLNTMVKYEHAHQRPILHLGKNDNQALRVLLKLVHRDFVQFQEAHRVNETLRDGQGKSE